jgi:hypothetical protein
MKEHPILFSTPMVRAILEGQKTQTRRVLKNIPTQPEPEAYFDAYNKGEFWNWWIKNKCCMPQIKCPYGAPGDRLWVRETFWRADYYPTTMPSGEPSSQNQGDLIHYAADGNPPNTPNKHYPEGLLSGFAAPDPYAIWHKRPSIHMPRSASRITLEIISVSVERVQEINRGGAMDEGCPFPNMADGDNPRDWFRDLWDSINAKRGYGWDKNPWVWVVEFKRTESAS